jgi:hypothetical protein
VYRFKPTQSGSGFAALGALDPGAPLGFQHQPKHQGLGGRSIVQILSTYSAINLPRHTNSTSPKDARGETGMGKWTLDDVEAEKIMVVADSSGALSAYNWFERLWKVQVGGVVPIFILGGGSVPQSAAYESKGIRCVLSVILPVAFKVPTEVDQTNLAMKADEKEEDLGMPFFLVCDGSPRVQVLKEDKVWFWIQMPCIIEAVSFRQKNKSRMVLTLFF